MTNGAMAVSNASSAAAAGAAIANAIKASGAIVSVEPRDFATLLAKAQEPLVVCAQGGLFSTTYQYLTSYKGLCFYTRSQSPVRMPAHAATIQAKKIWIPA